MHEFGIIKNILTTLEEVAKNEKLNEIQKVNLEIGELIHVVKESLIFAFETVAKDTIFEKAKLDIKIIPVNMKCNLCKKTFKVSGHDYNCPYCKKDESEIIEGKEIIIKSIEGD